MVAQPWGWTLWFTLHEFGLLALIAIVVSNLLVGFCFRHELRALGRNPMPEAQSEDDSTDASPSAARKKAVPVPGWVTSVHLFFLAFTVLCLHTPPLFLGGFLFFLAFLHLTGPYQNPLDIKSPLLVAFFLAGLVTHGNLQQWWLEPVLSSMSETTLFVGAALLTAFNDNAAITYLASLVPAFMHDTDLQIAVVQGAVTGGGLTVIANAPNPAGQSLLQRFFPNKSISPVYLLLGAAVPTVIVGLAFRLIYLP
jgi:Na+/H+ antiporter NhaD/arsenite permease-like protein